jgi:hypothetical protein
VVYNISDVLVPKFTIDGSDSVTLDNVTKEQSHGDHKCCSASHADTASISGCVLSVNTCPAALGGC